MITFDRTPRSVVALCRMCGARDVFTAQGPADTWAVNHIYTAHPDPSADRTRALTASRVRRHRDTP